jgi:hypothetical protein
LICHPRKYNFDYQMGLYLYFYKNYDHKEASSINSLRVDFRTSFSVGVVIGSLSVAWLAADILEGRPVAVLPFLAFVVILTVMIYYLFRAHLDNPEQSKGAEGCNLVLNKIS